MIITGALFVAYVAVFVAVAAAMVAVAWPKRGRPGLLVSETPLAQAGYWSAAVIPPVGFILGVVVATSREARHGLLVMGLAVIAAMLYAPLLLLVITG